MLVLDVSHLIIASLRNFAEPTNLSFVGRSSVTIFACGSMAVCIVGSNRRATVCDIAISRTITALLWHAPLPHYYGIMILWYHYRAGTTILIAIKHLGKVSTRSPSREVLGEKNERNTLVQTTRWSTFVRAIKVNTRRWLLRGHRTDGTIRLRLSMTAE